MRKFLTRLIVIPLGVIFVIFAVANRHLVTVSFDPFNSSNPSVGVTLPLFVVIIVVAILGVVAGSMATWFGQRHWRRTARRYEADARQTQARHTEAQMANLRASGNAPRERVSNPVPALAPPSG